MDAKQAKMGLVALMAVSAFGILTNSSHAQQGEVHQNGPVVVLSAPTQQSASAASARAAAVVDFKNAIPMPVPMVEQAPAGMMEGGVTPDSQGIPGFVSGAVGKGKMSPVRLPTSTPSLSVETDDEIAPTAYGTSYHPFTTTRVDITSSQESKYYPYRATGKLFFKDGSSTYVCSASLIKRGVIVTAAHCVASFGSKRFYSGFTFVPAQNTGVAPYGTWGYSKASVMSSYYDGTDSCSTKGVVCKNDIALIRLAPNNNTFPGTNTGWFGYGWDGYGFSPTNIALINQLGYPVTHDSGYKMQRTDSQGYVNAAFSNNTVWGSSQTGGSSGGPELVNLGIQPVLSGTSLGSEASPNVVVGVTSWGYVNGEIKQQGASPFTSSNIVPLINDVCGNPVSQAACQ